MILFVGKIRATRDNVYSYLVSSHDKYIHAINKILWQFVFVARSSKLATEKLSWRTRLQRRAQSLKYFVTYRVYLIFLAYFFPLRQTFLLIRRQKYKIRKNTLITRDVPRAMKIYSAIALPSFLLIKALYWLQKREFRRYLSSKGQLRDQRACGMISRKSWWMSHEDETTRYPGRFRYFSYLCDYWDNTVEGG